MFLLLPYDAKTFWEIDRLRNFSTVRRGDMKKALLAIAAWLMFTESAFGENNAIIYGVVDSTFEIVRASGATSPGANASYRQRVSSNSSLIGFKGAEDLGAGLKALFQIESGLTVDTGSGGVFASRDSFVGLEGSFGTFKLGFLTAPMRGLGGKLNFIPGSTSIANNIGIMTNLNGRALGFNSRMQNATMYTTPNWSGFSASFAYGANEGKVGSKNDPTYGLGINFDNGRLLVGYAYEERKDKEVYATAPGKDSNHRLAIQYAINNTRFGIGYDREKSQGTFASSSEGSAARNAVSASVIHKITAHEFILHYARARRLTCTGSADTGECAVSNVGNTGATQWSLAYHYLFSKQTFLEAYVTRIKNDAQAKYEFDVNPVVSTLASRAAGADPTGVGIGVRYTF